MIIAARSEDTMKADVLNDISPLPVAEIMRRLIAEAEAALSAMPRPS